MSEQEVFSFPHAYKSLGIKEIDIVLFQIFEIEIAALNPLIFFPEGTILSCHRASCLCEQNVP